MIRQADTLTLASISSDVKDVEDRNAYFRHRKDMNQNQRIRPFWITVLAYNRPGTFTEGCTAGNVPVLVDLEGAGVAAGLESAVLSVPAVAPAVPA